MMIKILLSSLTISLRNVVHELRFIGKKESDQNMTTTKKVTFDRLALYVLAVLISTVLFGVVGSFYSIIISGKYGEFGPTFFGMALLSFPFFALAAFPISIYIDFSSKIKTNSQWIQALLYIGSGGLVGLLVAVILNEFYLLISMLFFGIIGGVIHFLILTVIKKVIK